MLISSQKIKFKRTPEERLVGHLLHAYYGFDRKAATSKTGRVSNLIRQVRVAVTCRLPLDSVVHAGSVCILHPFD